MPFLMNFIKKDIIKNMFFLTIFVVGGVNSESIVTPESYPAAWDYILSVY